MKANPAIMRRIERALNAKGRLDNFRPLLDVARLFGQFDTDANGSLSSTELAAVLDSLGIRGDLLEEAMSGLDGDGDGQVSLEEWKANLSQRTTTLMTQKLNEQGLIEGLVATSAEAAAADAERRAEQRSVRQSELFSVATGGAVVVPDPMGPLACLDAGERGALWDAIRLAVDMDNTSPGFFPARLSAVALAPALTPDRAAAARALVAGKP